jgi:hypothetical protein
MNRQQLQHKSTDAWIWSKATPADVEAMVTLANTLYSPEVNQFFTPNPTRYSYHLHKAILDQTFNPGQQYLAVARDKATHQLLAYNWCERGKYTPYADEEMAVAEILHIDLAVPVRQRVQLVGQCFDQWIIWCELNRIPVLCSTSIREDQAAFMRLHSVYGFKSRGSFAYKEIKWATE